MIWPETAIPRFDPMNNIVLRNFILNNARSYNSYLLAGIADREGDKEYNSSILINPQGNIINTYHKIHLVPLGEYLPFPESFRKYKIFDRTGTYTHGKEQTIFSTPKGNFSVLICFESMFDGLARQMVSKGAEFLIVITNDAWFEHSNASKIHFINAVFHAAENRVWVVQSANTGYSGFVDPWGRIVDKTETFSRVDSEHEIFPGKGGTLYTRLGNWFPVFCLIGSFLLLFPFWRKRSDEIIEIEKRRE